MGATTFAQIGSTTGGYAWVALLDGVCVSQDGVGNAQMPVAGASAVAWTPGTLCNLASVSETITATAIFMLIQQGLINSVNEFVLPFIDSYIKKTYPDYKSLPGFETITIAELLNMTSRLMPNGLVEDAPLYYPGGPPAFINWYTQNYGIDPTQTYRYSNANFAILQAVVDSLTDGYEAYVQANIFDPMYINDMTITQPSANQALPYGASPPPTQQSKPWTTSG